MSVQVDVNARFVELVAKEMVACGECKQVIGSNDLWTIECMLHEGGNKEKAKAGIQAFITEVWDARDVSFFVKHGSRPGKFWVKFRSDLF